MATASSTTPLQEAVDLLGSALWILDLFAHRNKNQHRLSKWWAQFDMLRRNTRRLVADVQACLEAQARSSSSSSSLKKKQKKVAAAGAVGTSSQRERAEDAATRRMEARVRFMAEQIVPKAFL
jgi:ribonuclease MRP protein subunit RMP1